jgi:hypothetical protein
MDKLGIKTTFYDIFGYLIPGIISLTMLAISYCQLFSYDFKRVFAHISSISFPVAVLLLIFAYCAGHLISSLSSYIVERKLLQFYFKIPTIRLLPKIEIIRPNSTFPFLTAQTASLLDTKCKTIFGSNIKDIEFRLCITHVESNAPEIYSTAFVFLSFYGMARNMALLFIIWAMFEILCYKVTASHLAASLSGISLVFSIIFSYEYIRFYKYFIQEIIGGFITSKAQ